MAKSPRLTQKNGKRLAGGKAIPKGDFALPGAGPGGKDAYPVDTAGRARSALSRVAANGTPAEQAKVKAAVRAKYPSVQVDGKKTPAKRGASRKGK